MRMGQTYTPGVPFATSGLFRRHAIASCGDLDDARQVLSEVFLPLDFPNASAATKLNMSLNVVKVGRVTLGYLRFGDAVRIRTAHAANFHVDIPLAGRATMRAGHRVPVYGTPRTAAVFTPGLPADLDCDAEFAQVSVMVPTAGLNLELENFLGHSVTKPLEFSSELDLTTNAGCAVLQTLHLIDLASNDEHGLLQHPLSEQRLEQVLMGSLLLAQPHNYSEALNSTVASAGSRPVAKAVDLLRAHPEHPWTVSGLASEVAVSVRSLQEGFRRSVGTTPMGYLRELRLERAHAELSNAEPGSVTVTEVAAKWGIGHLGRFASDYRRRFSEHPSDTIRRPSL
jgi:AraC-like DNA-binding protein